MEDNIKPYWEQTMNKEKMSIEEAETIIDDMYQDRHKIIEERNGRGVTIHVDKLDDVKFTNLEFASVRALREIQSLRRKVENSILESKLRDYLTKRIDNVKECYENLIKPYYDEKLNIINTTSMTKKEKEEFINKRNCLLVQKQCYNEILKFMEEK